MRAERIGSCRRHDVLIVGVMLLLGLATSAGTTMASVGTTMTLGRANNEGASPPSVAEWQGEFRVGDRQQPYRLLVPTNTEPTSAPAPVIIFSHGAYSANDAYDAILLPWVEAGFIVLAPTHADSITLGVARGTPNPEFFGWRLADMDVLLNELARLVTQHGVSAQADLSRIVVAGHSFGGLVAQTLAGAGATPPSQTRTESITAPTSARSDARIRCAIVISGAGLIPGMVEPQDLLALKRPLLVTVGTDDLEQLPGMSGYAWRRQPYDYAGAAKRWLLTLEDADHYLGGQVGRDDLIPSPYAADYRDDFLRVSQAFLDGCVGDVTDDGQGLDAPMNALSQTPLRRSRLEQARGAPP